jgi:hypothetical protein
MGIRGVYLVWFCSYLIGRTQYVSINNVHSHPMPVSAGVPQGSTLGPIICLLFINDMAMCRTKLELIHFTDDITALATGTDFGDLCTAVNSDLSRIDEWLCMCQHIVP